ncbi:LacI family DNA-binding transcriptional regulator [Mucilaginibacter sp. AW1-3]
MKNKEITIYDIAKELDISPATVSRGLRDHPAISKKTKKKIMDIAKSMGYRSNTFASSLRLNRTNTIGVIVHRLDSFFVSTVLAGMEKVASESGYNLIISQSLESTEKEIANANTMFNSRVDGLMASLSYDTEDISHFMPFIDKGIPLLFFDRVYNHKNCPAVVIDNFKSAYEITTHLIEQGCKKIVHVTGDLKRNVYADRYQGYRKALQDNGLKFTNELLIINYMNEHIGPNVDAVKQILAINPLPDGAFITNDAFAAYCMRELKVDGISIPGDIAIAGFNNDPISGLVDPNLTTINYPSYEMGEVAARTLINHLKGTSNMMLTDSIVLKSELIIRESSLKKQV